MGAVANMVLCFAGLADIGHVSVPRDFNIKGKMVSVLFCNGEDLGKSNPLWYGIPLQSRKRTRARGTEKLHARG